MTIALLLQVILWAAAGDGPPSCPTREAVAQAVAQATPPAPHDGGNSASTTKATRELPPTVQIADLGDAFEVAVGHEVQRYADPARDCVERARVAAVFVALALNPPAAPAPLPPARPVAAPPPALAPPPPAVPTAARVGVAARFDAAAGGGEAATHGAAIGGELRLAFGRRALGLQGTAGAMSATESVVKDVRVREQRFPCSVAGTVRRALGSHVEVGAAAGLSLTPFTLSARGLMSPSPATRLDVGARLEVAARWIGHALAPFAAVHVEYFPRTYDVSVMPLGAIGTTAPVQVGVSAGLDLSLHGPR